MTWRPTVLLRHRTRQGVHYDWLLDPPAPAATPAGEPRRLWTARLARPFWRWPRDGQVALTVLKPHRRVYLTYQGPLTRGRGTVRRVDRGRFRVLLWTPRRLRVELHLRRFRGLVDCRRRGERWLATCKRAIGRGIKASGGYR